MTGFPVIRDSITGVRRAGTATHWDDAAGVRHAIQDIGRYDKPLPLPPPAPPPVTATRFLGYYSGSLTDDGMRTTFGRYPEITASYWQLGNAKNALATEKARAQRGIGSHAVIAPIDKASTFPTGARDYINGLVAGTAFYVDFFSDWLNALQQASLAAPAGTPKMIMFPMCEPEVHHQLGNLNSLKTSLGGSVAATMARVGEYHQALYDLAKVICPNVKRGVWIGGSSDRYTDLNNMFAQIANGVEYFGTDPYQNNAANGSRPRAVWAGRINAARAANGAHHTHWLRWGSPKIILTETGISHYRPNTSTYMNTDAQKAAWVRMIREDMVTEDLERVVYFGSAGPNGRQMLTPDGSVGDFGPQARAAFGLELAEAAPATPPPGVVNYPVITAISPPTTLGDPDTTGVVKEISGVVVSRKNTAGARLLWGVNDQGTNPYVYAFRDQAGNNLKHRLELTGVTVTSQVQMEEISKCRMPDGTTEALMIGRIGDGYTHFIRVPEPTVSPTGAYGTSTAAAVEFHFVNQSSGNNHEAFFVDPLTNDLYLIEKNGATARPRVVRVWKIPNSVLTTAGRPAGNPIALGPPVATIKCDIESTGSGAPTAADISDDGKSILVGNYQELMVWRRDPATETVEQALRRGGSTTTPSDPHVRLWVPSTAPNTLGAESYCFDKGPDPSVGFSIGESTAGTSALKQFVFSY